MKIDSEMKDITKIGENIWGKINLNLTFIYNNIVGPNNNYKFTKSLMNNYK